MRQILHISDIHFGPHHEAAVSEAVLDLAERRRPDLVVISGDLTQRAKPYQFAEARAFVDRLPVPSIAVPGNHDVPAYRVWERVFAPFGAYRRHFADDLEPVWQDDELFVVGVNSAFNWTVKDGRIRRSRLRHLADQLAAAPPGKIRVVVVHHQLTPPPRYETRRVLYNAAETVALLDRLDVELVLSGHLHQTWIAPSDSYYPAREPSGRRPFLILHAGTTTSRRGRGCERKRFSANWVRVDDASWTLSHLMWEPAEARFVEASRHLYPRRRREPFALDVL